MNKYNEDYYERGVQLGISGYTNYRWLPQLTIPMCEKIAGYLCIPKHKRILDFGCAKGYLVKGFQELGYQCDGTDISEYALSQAHPDIKNSLFLYSLDNIFGRWYDTVIAKDVFEHIEPEHLSKVLLALGTITDRIFCAVPLGDEGKYFIPEYEGDITHIIRQPKDWWVEHFNKSGWKTQFFSYLLDGVKDNWSHYPKGNGFFILSC
jgi:SAM-dependent methyltransferase